MRLLNDEDFFKLVLHENLNLNGDWDRNVGLFVKRVKEFDLRNLRMTNRSGSQGILNGMPPGEVDKFLGGKTRRKTKRLKKKSCFKKKSYIH